MIASHVDLTPYNTFGIQVFAKEFASFSTVAQLHQLVNSNREKELFILGGGSNILFTQDFNGLILRNEILGKEVVQDGIALDDARELAQLGDQARHAVVYRL